MRIDEVGFAQRSREGRERCSRDIVCETWAIMRYVERCWAVLRLVAALPDGEQRPALRYARSPRDCAWCASIEVVVQRLDIFGAAIACENIRQRGAGECRQGQAQEYVEGW